MSSPRRSPALVPVSPPLFSTPLSRLIYILITLSILLLSYYSYRGLQYKSAVGGWWNMALGRPPIINSGIQENLDKSGLPRCFYSAGRGNGEDESVEDRINGLASVLGVPPKELASAIAGVVRQHAPASVSSVAAKATGKVREMPGVAEQVVNSFNGLDGELE